MSKPIVTELKLTAIGNAIRTKTGGSAELTLDEMATAVSGISGGTEITPYASSNTRYVSAGVYDGSTTPCSTYFFDFGASVRFVCVIKKQQVSPRFRVAFCDTDPSQSGTTSAVLSDGNVGDDDSNLTKFFGSDAFPNSYKKKARYIAVTVHNSSASEPAPTVILYDSEEA